MICLTRRTAEIYFVVMKLLSLGQENAFAQRLRMLCYHCPAFQASYFKQTDLTCIESKGLRIVGLLWHWFEELAVEPLVVL